MDYRGLQEGRRQRMRWDWSDKPPGRLQQRGGRGPREQRLPFGGKLSALFEKNLQANMPVRKINDAGSMQRR